MGPRKKDGNQGATTNSSNLSSETNVQVIVRCRPRSEEEVEHRTPEVVTCDALHKEVQLTQSVGGKQFNRKYHFDRVYGPETTQEMLYETAVAPMVDEVLQGFNCTVFAYGQTGTGKTHTMTGDMVSPSVTEGSGVIPRAVGQIFSYLEGLAGVNEFTVKCSFLELYNEEITDLLAIGSEPPKVRILEDRSGVVLQGLEEPHVKVAGDIFSLLETGNARRRTAETLLNKQSSRSHSVFVVTVSVREVLAEGEEVIRVGKLYLVDLAGSENITRSGAVDQRAKEAGNINKSLLTLGRVITALVEGQVHVPYRDSKLTRLLRDSLGGKTKTCIIATIAPTVQCQEETMSTLDYAHRAKNIKNKPEVNQKISKTTHLKEMGVEIARLKAELVATREKNGVYIPHAQYEEDCARMKEQQETIEKLEAEAEVVEEKHEEEKAALIEEWDAKVQELVAMKEELESNLHMTRAELAAAKEDIAERDYIIHEQQTCQGALAQHAVGLTGDLATAFSDIQTLFTRVDVKNMLEDKNAVLLNDMCEDTVTQISTMDRTLQAAVAAQMDLLGNAQNKLQNLSSMQQKMMDDSRESLVEAKSKMDEMLTGLHEALRRMAESSTTSIDAMAQRQEKYHDMADASARKVQKELDNVLETMNTKAQEEKAAMDALQALQAQHAETLKEAITAFTGDIRLSMETALAQVSSMKQKLEESLASQQRMTETFSADFVQTNQVNGQALVEQIQHLVGDFVSKTNQKVGEFSETLQETMATDGRALASNLDGVSKAAHESFNHMARHEESVAATQAQMHQETDTMFDNLYTCHNGHVSTALEMHETMHAHLGAATEQLKKHSKAIASKAKKDVDALKVDLEAHQNNAYTMVETIKTVAEELEDAGKSHHAAHTHMVDQILQSTQACEKDLSSFAEDHKDHLGQMSCKVSDTIKHEYAVDAERDNVPARNERSAPSKATIDSLCAPSIETLSRRFRSGSEMNNNQEPDDAMVAPLPNDDTVQQQDDDDDDAQPTDIPADKDDDQEENAAPNIEDGMHDAEEDVADEPAKKVTRKRSRSAKAASHESPSKLKAAFQKGERRRRGAKVDQ
ncbi:hypothetical protein M9435_002268 [Picochlorum sp. BPE23]|nr:hypothetical protein M9435_002268 [Picochlorum sp. BPE23]